VAFTGLGLVLVALLALAAEPPAQPLDPEGPGPDGAMATAEVLRDRGVDIEVVRSISALEASAPGRGTSVVVGEPTDLGPGATIRLRDATREADRLVVVDGDSGQLEGLGLEVDAYEGGAEVELVARCEAGGAKDPDTVGVVDVRYIPRPEAPAGTTTCFAVPDPDSPDGEATDDSLGSAMVVLPRSERHAETVLLGFGSGLGNGRVTDASHAGVAVRALGASPRLVWYQPSPGDLVAPGSPGDDPGPGDSVWPVWTTPVIALAALVLVLLALTRGRRLGRVVPEQLPVVVRAAETTESRGRLYRRASDRTRAATVLRLGTHDRLASRLGLPRGTGPAALVHAVAVATGAPATEVGAILYGAPPTDDGALIVLAQQLTDLEERLRSP
jgi:Domain of unknown function (DUF4350)